MPLYTYPTRSTNPSASFRRRPAIVYAILAFRSRPSSTSVKAILCERYGAPDDLVFADVPDPVAGPGEVVAKVAGVVESVGPRVTEFQPGDRVMGYTNYNAARERTAVAAGQIVKLSADLDFERAAALTITYGTAYHALKHRARMQPGETLAVLGAAGGVGLATVELGRIMGARVIACASSDDKLAFARAHGAHEVVNYDSEDLRAALKRIGGDHGIDVVFDPVGGPYSEPAVRSLAWQGRHLVVGFAAGEIPKLPLNLVLLKGCAILGVFWGSWVRRDKDEYKAAIDQLAHWCAEGKLSCHIQEVYPLAETPTALKALAERKVMGKLVVRV